MEGYATPTSARTNTSVSTVSTGSQLADDPSEIREEYPVSDGGVSTPGSKNPLPEQASGGQSAADEEVQVSSQPSGNGASGSHVRSSVDWSRLLPESDVTDSDNRPLGRAGSYYQSPDKNETGDVPSSPKNP